MKLRKKIWGAFAVLLTVLLSISVIFISRAQFGQLVADAATEYLVINEANAEDYLDIRDGGTTLYGFKTNADQPVVGISDKKVIVLEIPNGVTQISKGFAGYTNLYSVVLPASVGAIESGAFEGCTHLAEVCDLTNGRITESEDCGQITDYALNVCYSESDRTLQKIGDFAFVKNTNAENGENGYQLIAYFGTQSSLTLPSDFGGKYDIYADAFAGDGNLTEVYLNNTNVQIIGGNAFGGCLNLRSISLPEGLKEIGEDAFYDCAQLRTLTIPASVTKIGAHAFFNCRNLSSVAFAEGDGATELSIGKGAFEECRWLVSANFPKHLKELHARAFYGAGLSTVYLPDGVDYLTDGEGERNYFDGAALTHFIFKTREAYLNGLPNSALADYRAKMTYLVNISFDFGTANQTCDSEVRLAGEIYSYTAGDNYVWSGTAQSRFVSLPLQNGYSTTVWYADEAYANKIGTVTFGGALVGSDNSKINEYLAATVTESGTEVFTAEDITLHARYLAKPAFTAKRAVYSRSLSYPLNDESCLFDLVDGWYEYENRDPSVELGAEDHLLIASYNGSSYGAVGPEAGTYPISFRIKNADAFGAWTTPYTVNAVIERITFDVGNYTDWCISWGDNEPVSLIENQKLYIYEREVGSSTEKIPFVTELSSEEIAEKNLRPNPEVRTLTNSVARYRRGEEITLDYVFRYGYNLGDILNDWQFIDADEEGNYQRTASNAGVYTARIVLTANENYRLISDLTTANDRGIVINFNEDRSAATITKTWYIVEIANQVVVDLEYGTYDERIPYSIANWTYGESDPVLPQAPAIEIYDRMLGSDTLTRLSFTLHGTLYSGGEIAFSDIRRSTFNRFINATMPAGNYVLTVSVPEVTDEADVYYPAYQENFPFTVYAATLDPALFRQADEALKNQSFAFKRDGEIHFYDPTIALDVLSLTGLNPDFGNETENVWARSDYREYYSTGVSISYNLNRMADSNYFTEREFDEGKTHFAPLTADKYTVYYQISAKNYVPHVDTSSDLLRREFVFTVTVFEEFSAPSFHTEHLVYTGEEVLPEIGESSAYEVIKKTDDDYVSVGEHTLVLRLYNFVPSKWEGKALPTDEDDPNMELELTYRIARAQNETVGTLNLIRWTWGNYPADSKPVFNTRFKDTEDENFYTFTLTSHSDPTDIYIYGTEKGFEKAPAGSYTFTAYAKGYDQNVAGSEKYSWEAYSTQLDEVRIAPATNRWLETPNIVRWHWGEFDRTENIISARPAYPVTGAVVTYSVLDENRQPVKDVNGNEIAPLKGFTTDGDGRVSAEIAALLERLNVGTYYLIAKAEGAGNYSALDTSREDETPLSFRILQAQNLWEETPNIISWNEGNYDAAVNLMFAKAKFGEAVITLTRADGTPIDISELGSLKAGAYKMRAVVSETENYTGLDSELDFAVSLEAGPLGSPTGQIVALCVIGVLGVGLAVTLIVNIVRIKRETDEELKNNKY